MKKYLEVLNSMQREAVLHSGAPLLILAGAGSGKTRVITTKIAYLIEELGVHPYSILAVTFTNKAAQEMKNRVLEMTGRGEQVMIRTFHSFGAWLLRRNARILGLNENFSIYDEDDKLSLLKLVLKTAGEEKLAPSELRHLAHGISRAKERCLEPEDDLSVLGEGVDFEHYYKLYHTRLREIGNADFGDLIMRPVELLNQNFEIRERLRKRFRVILVDEFQDSNHAQLELLKQLHGEGNYLCVVGDEDQSIYKFRGAEVRNIIEFPEIFDDTDVIMLEQNYRSTPNILNVASEVVSNNQYRMGKNLWTDLPEGEPVRWVTLPNPEAEARFCAQLLQESPFEDTAILYRNNYQSRPFETLFENLAIPYKIVGSLRFYEREEIKDTIAWLQWLSNPRDEVAFLRIINKPARGLGNKSVEKIRSMGSMDMVSCCKQAVSELSGRARKGLQGFLLLHGELEKALRNLKLSDSIREVFTRSGLLDYYSDKDTENRTSRVQNLYELMNAAISYPAGIEGLNTFLDTISLSGSEESSEEGRVTLITIHNTKGLEFDRVILTGLEDGLFPHLHPSGEIEPEELEEERRLFYVGITRAKSELYLTNCQCRLVYGEYRESYHSRFLDEIPGEWLIKPGEQERKGASAFELGDYVRHADYGKGTIIDKAYKGNTLVVFIEFESGRKVQLIPKYNKLERIF